ncbi:MAG: GGDEF domain-containing protein [Desulfobulbaceae bacterium]|nr:GGDEF domain-containing protein [Desulfobulbaceae bacterium]HIJ78284.1 GGDEF domain-containing protein [Deltaproteobacteria bacterium]
MPANSRQGERTMAKNKANIDLKQSFEKIRNDLSHFIDLSQQEDEKSWLDWIASITTKIETKCWERKNCKNINCPAYKNSCGRCWIIAGTMLPGAIHCDFAQKYESCKTCEVYQDAVCRDPITEIEEHLFVLVHSLRQRQQELKEIATTDFLTEIHNRRFFDSYLSHEYEKIKRNDTSLAIMMIDVDFFKEINDSYGHGMGDQVLKECAQILLKATRQSDMVARYGGDEFIIALHENQQNQNHPSVLIKRIEEYLAHRNSCKGKNVPALSLSFGYAILTKNKDIAETIKKADENMYSDKARRKTMQ